ncbi:uncharacterized protein METZ01_LOCUS379182, partial [marine metagenome]
WYGTLVYCTNWSSQPECWLWQFCSSGWNNHNRDRRRNVYEFL